MSFHLFRSLIFFQQCFIALVHKSALLLSHLFLSILFLLMLLYMELFTWLYFQIVLCTLVVYRDTTDLYILVSYPATLLNSLNISNSFMLLLIPYGFVYKIQLRVYPYWVFNFSDCFFTSNFFFHVYLFLFYFCLFHFIISYFLLLEIISSFMSLNVLNLLLLKSFSYCFNKTYFMWS